jgi:hypothetical protein
MKFEKRKEFVRAWTSEVRHFGNITTSRCEGGHQKLKDHLINNRHDILDIISRLKQLTDDFINEYRKDHSKWRDRIPQGISMARFGWLFAEGIHNKVVPEALKKVAQQVVSLKKYEEDLRVAASSSPPPCSGHFTQVYGIPCWPELKALRTANRKLTANDFRSFYHFERINKTDILKSARPPLPGPTILLLNVVVRSRGRPRRDPSQWELSSRLHSTPVTRQPLTQRPGSLGGATSLIDTVSNQRCQ